MSKIEVSFTPENYNIYKNNNSIVVVTDILRATSVICTALEQGAKEIIPIESLEIAKKYNEQGFLVGAERNGEKIKGFALGNSPYSYINTNIKNKTIYLTTTNGTRAIEMAKESFKILIGAFINLTAVVQYLKNKKKDIVILCSGWKGRYTLEDTLFAGALSSELYKITPEFDLEDSALSAMYLYNLAKKNPYKFLSKSSHRKRLKKLNLKEDIRYCLQFDLTKILPYYINGKIIPMKNI